MIHSTLKYRLIICSFLFSSADYDYRAPTCALVFKPSVEMKSLQQCLEIEIINDSLPEDWEVFTLLLSTNNSAVDLIVDRIDVYIQPNNGKHYVARYNSQLKDVLDEQQKVVYRKIEKSTFRHILACHNNNMRNPSLHIILWGYACCYCCMQLSFVCIHEL